MGDETYTVVGLGELIWDMLPEGRRLGGRSLPCGVEAHETRD